MRLELNMVPCIEFKMSSPKTYHLRFVYDCNTMVPALPRPSISVESNPSQCNLFLPTSVIVVLGLLRFQIWCLRLSFLRLTRLDRVL